MRNGGSSAKGAGFERTVCRTLSLWLSHGTRDDLMWRSSMSGGRATLGRKKGLKRGAQAGDISAIDRLAQTFLDTFSIECKHYKDLQLRNLLTGAKGGINSFWRQAVTDAAEHHKLPLMVAKQNFLPVLLGLNAAGVTVLDAGGELI